MYSELMDTEKVPTVGNTVETTQTNRQVGDTTVRKETVLASEQVDSHELGIARVNQVIWLIVHLIAIVVVLRFVFLLFDANLRGFALLIYNLSTPFVAPFKGIFATPQAGGSYFDSASLLALAIWYLLGYILTRILYLFSRRTTVETP